MLIVLGAMGILPPATSRAAAQCLHLGRRPEEHDKPARQGNTTQFLPDGLSTAPAAAGVRHLRCQNAR